MVLMKEKKAFNKNENALSKYLIHLKSHNIYIYISYKLVRH